MTPSAAIAVTLAAVAAAAAPPARPRSVRRRHRPDVVGPGRGGVSTRPGAGPGGGALDGPADGSALTPVARVATAALVAVGAGLLLPGWLGPGVAVVAGALSWHLLGRLESRAARRRRERLAADLPHVVDLMAAALGSGDAPPAAVARIAAAVGGPAGAELAAVVSRLHLGADPVATWRALGRHPQLGPLGVCLARAAESGASVSEAMRRLAGDLRRRRRAEAEVRARAVGVRATAPLGLCLLPAFVLVGVVPLVVGSVSVLLHR